MLNIFQKNATTPNDVKGIRDSFLRFTKEQLQKSEGGEGFNIRSLQFFIFCAEADKNLYEAALYVGEEDRFKNEVQKIADDYAIDLPEDWTVEISFVDTPPPETMKLPDLDAALFIQTRKRSIHKASTAYIRVVIGEAEKERYSIQSTDGRINIGREKQVQTENGFFRTNHIAFPSAGNNEHNKYISRQHAHIEYDNDAGVFLLFADEGGVPPRNKVKVLSIQSAEPIKLYSTHIGYALKEGDQVRLGESAVIEFSYNE